MSAVAPASRQPSGLVADTIDELWSPEVFEARTGIPRGTQARWRVEGKGPPYLKLGRAVRYRASDVMRWLASNARHSTSDPGSANDNAPVAAGARR